MDVRLAGGRIEAVGTPGSLTAVTRAALRTVDLSGYLLLPAPAEPHAHSDTGLTADADGPVSYDTEDVQRRTTEAALPPARARRRRGALTRPGRRRPGARRAGGRAPGQPFAARARRADGGRRCPGC